MGHAGRDAAQGRCRRGARGGRVRHVAGRGALPVGRCAVGGAGGRRGAVLAGGGWGAGRGRWVRGVRGRGGGKAVVGRYVAYRLRKLDGGGSPCPGPPARRGPPRGTSRRRARPPGRGSEARPLASLSCRISFSRRPARAPRVRRTVADLSAYRGRIYPFGPFCATLGATVGVEGRRDHLACEMQRAFSSRTTGRRRTRAATCRRYRREP